ncbi:helix-turn-helix transcriptional regulator [Dehalococcoides sp. THU3]|uniref:helix-turn-helix domain-containing protein n=1 Tax=Dehalococcoides TaxID=61434 RepID=UPI0032184053
MNTSDLGNALNTIQEALGLNDKELAIKLGISNSYFSRIKRGIRKPTVKFYSGIGRAFPELKPLIDAEIYGKTNYTPTDIPVRKTPLTRFLEIFK